MGKWLPALVAFRGGQARMTRRALIRHQTLTCGICTQMDLCIRHAGRDAAFEGVDRARPWAAETTVRAHIFWAGVRCEGVF